MNNFISISNKFKLVIYTNEESSRHINTRENPNIKIVIKPFDQFYCYKFRESWIKNHSKNTMLNEQSQFNTDWELNMLWSEKSHLSAKQSHKNTSKPNIMVGVILDIFETGKMTHIVVI